LVGRHADQIGGEGEAADRKGGTDPVLQTGKSENNNEGRATKEGLKGGGTISNSKAVSRARLLLEKRRKKINGIYTSNTDTMEIHT